MTIKFPDVSNHNYPLSMSGASVVIAKATEGSTFKDAYYNYFKNQAVGMGVPFMGYHWINTADLTAQAKNAFSMVGPGTPLMWDAEADGVTVNRLLDITDRYRSLGGIVHMLYLPKWWWRDHMGSPDLTPLARDGLHLISSNYTSYSDSGPGWDPYGGMTPVQWQYTNAQMFNGKPVDFNAYKGTAEDYRQLISGGVDMTPEQANQLTQIFSAMFPGGTSCGDAVPPEDAIPAGTVADGTTAWANGVMSQLQHLHRAVDRIETALANGGNGGGGGNTPGTFTINFEGTGTAQPS